MKTADGQQVPGRVLVVMPSWVGDVVMATPTLRAMRELYPQAEITALMRESVRPILDACPWVDRVLTVRRRAKGVIGLVRRLSRERVDMAVLLSNSFRTALTVMLAGIGRRVGYDRDGRGFLLTDRLLPRRGQGGYVPVPTREYYLGVAKYLGARDTDGSMQLFTREADDEALAVKLEVAGVSPGERPLVLLMPGAGYGPAKMWPAERFGALADRCVRELGAAVAVAGSPKERVIVGQVIGAAKTRLVDLSAIGVDLRLLKSAVKRSSLVVTNDTGPRHMAAAFGVPLVTLFGPTDPAWTEIGFQLERQLMVKVECGPCQLKKCPLDHRCMKLMDVGMVFARAADLMGVGRGVEG